MKIFFACIGALLLAGCAPGRSCLVPETDAAGLAPFIMPGQADIGRTFRMRGFLLQDWEQAYLFPAAPGETVAGPNEMRYCFTCATPRVWRALRRMMKAAPAQGSRRSLSGNVDVVAEYLGRAANSDCWLGEVRIIGIVSAPPSKKQDDPDESLCGLDKFTIDDHIINELEEPIIVREFSGRTQFEDGTSLPGVLLEIREQGPDWRLKNVQKTHSDENGSFCIKKYPAWNVLLQGDTRGLAVRGREDHHFV